VLLLPLLQVVMRIEEAHTHHAPYCCQPNCCA
jgi:hypothetical protein